MSPLASGTLFHIGPAPITEGVVATWAIMAALAGGAALATRRLKLAPSRTLGIQAVNVAILVWLLQRFFWRPVSAMIEQRRMAVQRTVAEAEASRTQAAAALADVERTRAGFGAERGKLLADAREAAERDHAATLDGRRQAGRSASGRC